MPVALVKEELIQLLQISLVIPVSCLVACSGMLTNVFNITVFFKLGFKNTMSVGTMALAATDLFVCCVQLAVEVCYALNYAFSESGNIDYYVLGAYAIGWFKYAGIYVSIWITTLIATERCVCVVFPFKVKQICTKLVYLLTLSAIYVTYLSLVLPIYIGQRLVWLPQTAPKFNESEPVKYILTVEYNDDVARLEIIFDAIGVYGLATFAQIILLICTASMAFSLKASSLVRVSGNMTPNDAHESTASARALVAPLSSREKKLIKVAVCLAVVMTTCNIPRYTVISVFSLWPRMRDEENATLAYFLWDVSDVFVNINCSCSFLVYVIINQNFRKCFYEIVRKSMYSS